MIEVTRDHEWITILKDITERDKVRKIKQLGFYFKLTDTIWKAKKHYDQLKQEKINSRIKIIDKVKPTIQDKENVKPNLVCGAKNMNGQPCKFKAVCGEFCKKHSRKN